MLKQFKNAGIKFSYGEGAMVPEIPRVRDVLYAMRLIEEQYAYDHCLANHATYVANVGLVIAAVAVDVLCQERYDEAVTRKIVAEAIVRLCPPEAKCLFVGAYVDAKRLVNPTMPDVAKMPRDEQRAACDCKKCVETTREEQPPTISSPYRGIPAAHEYRRYAAKVETPSSSKS